MTKVFLIFYMASLSGERVESVVVMDNMEQCQKAVEQFEDRLVFQMYIKCEEMK